MKRLLGRTGLPKAIGLYIDDHAVTVSQIVSTPFGLIETGRNSENADPDELASVLRRLVTPLLGRHKVRQVPVAIGVPVGQVYFTTRPIQDATSNPSPHVLLREALRSPDVSINEMAVDVIKARPDKRSVASLVSCSKKYLTGLLDSLQECDVRPLRAEPAPCALLRAAAKRHRARRGAKVVIRLFLSDARALAVLVVNGLPVVWRCSSVFRGDEASTIISLSRSLLTVSKDCGIESALDAVMLHGRAELAQLLDVQWVEKQLGVPMEWFEGPSLDASQVAFGLAVGCFNHDKYAFDLAGSLKPRLSLWRLFPWREATLQTVLLACMAMFLVYRLYVLDGSYAVAQAHNTAYTWMESVPETELEKQKAELQQKVTAVKKFLGSRITWTSYGRELAESLPPNVFLTSFHGTCELGAGGKKKGVAKPQKSLVLRGAVSVPQDGLIPREIDRFLNTLREHPVLKRDFPVVELADLKQTHETGDDNSFAFFTVTCLPKARKGASK